jgi:nucleoid-associated protein
MALRFFITHQISKAGNDPAAKLNCSVLEGNADEGALAPYYEQAASQLKGILMQRSGKCYGVFSDEQPSVRGLIKNWQRDSLSFQSFSKRLTEHLSATLDNSKFEIDGYLAYFYETLADYDKLYVFHLRHKVSVSVGADMSLTESRYIDFSNTGFGICINLTDWQQDSDSKYITFSYGRGDKPLQNHMSASIGFTDTLNTQAETEEFLSIVDQYSQTLPEEQRFEYKAKVVDYCMEQDLRGDPVVFHELADHLAAETESQPAEVFSNFIIEKKKQTRQQQSDNSGLTPEQQAASSNEGTPAIKDELIPDRKQLRGFIRYSGKNKDLSISFSANLMGEAIEFDADKKRLIVNTIPDSLLKQLNGKSRYDDKVE